MVATRQRCMGAKYPKKTGRLTQFMALFPRDPRWARLPNREKARPKAKRAPRNPDINLKSKASIYN
jgi:hypothetical protein